MLKIIKSKDSIFLVQIAEKYYIVRHDPSVNRTYAAHHTDIVKGFEPRSAYGFTEKSVQKVAKARTLKTACTYFTETLRHRSRADNIKKMSFTSKEHFEAGNSMQDAVS